MTRLMVTVAMLAGCSVALQKPPASGRSVDASCSSSYAYAVVDGVITAAAVAATVYGLANRPERGYVAGVGAPTAILFVSSARAGAGWARSCRVHRDVEIAAR